MAQYYRVLSQDDKDTEEVAQFYPNIDENQTVQYVIASDNTQQQFQAQPVVVSSEQLMVVDGQAQQVIIDQSQVAYQPSSYVIQDTSGIDFQNNRQPVYYMTNTPSTQPVVIEEPITQQPVVLNHQLNQIAKVNINSPMHQTCTTTPLNATVIQDKNSAMQQIRNQLKTQTVRQNNVMNNTRTIQMNQQVTITIFKHMMQS
jgi:hypothetical protein